VPHAPADQTVTPDLLRRQAAVAAALRVVATEAQPEPQSQQSAPQIDLAELQERLDRLTARLDRLDDKVELIVEPDEEPLSWPSPVAPSDRLEVPPLTTSRANSPAYDVLLGPAVRRSSA
jgi:hypothetical protein